MEEPPTVKLTKSFIRVLATSTSDRFCSSKPKPSEPDGNLINPTPWLN